MTVENRNQQIYVMGKERPTETVIMANVEENRMLALIEGYLNMRQLPRFIEILSENDGEFDALFGNLFRNRIEEEPENVQEEVIDTIQN